MDKIKQILKDLPEKSGVYIMKSKQGQILYIGKARNLKNRVNQYFGNNSNRTNKVLIMVSKIVDIEYIITNNEIEALVLENNLIKKHKPPYNILLKDDKSYPFVKITSKKQFPKVEVVRRLSNDGAKYFGPYMLGVSSRDIVDLIYWVFPVRHCNLNMNKVPASHRPCLNYHIKRCLAPCVKKVTQKEYAEVIADVIAFLNGNDKKIAQLLTNKMKKCSEDMEYELALQYKQKLDVLDKLIRKQVTALPKEFDMDIFAIASNGLNTVIAILFVRGGKLVGGDKQIVNDFSCDNSIALSNFLTQYYDNIKYIASEVVVAISIEDDNTLAEYLSEVKGSRVNVITPIMGIRRQLADMAQNNANDYLEKSLSLQERQENSTIGAIIQLQEYLDLGSLPLRIECYDISHISGTDKVASMVVAISGQMTRGHYRKFRIKEVEGNNDYASLQEALTRRLQRLNEQESDESFASVPDLVVIDGGKGQLSSVMEIFEKFDTKNITVIALAEREEEIFIVGQSTPIILPKNSYSLKLLQRIRDEAHRFAITFHRQTRTKRQTHSRLLDIKGLGEKRLKILYNNFKTIDNMRKASIEQFMMIKGIDRPTAENIVDFFENEKKKSSPKN